MAVRKLEIDIDKGILNINENDYTETPVMITLPGPDGWPLQKLYNHELASGKQEECDRLVVSYSKASNKP